MTILRDADRMPVPVLARMSSVSGQTRYVPRRGYGGIAPDEGEGLMSLGADSARLEELQAERDLEVEAAKEVAAGKGGRARAPRPGGPNRAGASRRHGVPHGPASSNRSRGAH